MPFIFGQPEQTSCVYCNRLRTATNGKVEWCLRHDPNISAEDRKKYGVAYEQLPALREEISRAMTKNNPFSGESTNG